MNPDRMALLQDHLISYLRSLVLTINSANNPKKNVWIPKKINPKTAFTWSTGFIVLPAIQNTSSAEKITLASKRNDKPNGINIFIGFILIITRSICGSTFKGYFKEMKDLPFLRF